MNSFIRKIKTLFTIAVWLFRMPSAVAVPVCYGKKKIHKVENEFLDGLYVNQWGFVDVVIDGKVVCRGTNIGDFVFGEKHTEETEPLMENPYAKALALALLLSASLAFAFTSGDGTYENPYEIAGQSDIVNLIDMVATNDCSGLYFLQTADIDLTTFGNFTPIGSASAPFAGNYDGDGYILSNLTITASVSGATTNAFGYFGYIENATVENLSVQGSVSVSADYNASACVAVGGVVGFAKSSILAALVNYCSVSGTLSNAVATSMQVYMKNGVSGVVGISYHTALTTQRGLENHGDISFFGMNGVSCVSGVACANISYNAAVGDAFVGCDNYGKVSGSGISNTLTADAFVSGVCSIHYSGTSGSKDFFKVNSCSNFGELEGSGVLQMSGVVSASESSSETKRLSANNCTNYADITFAYADSSAGFAVAGVAINLGNTVDANIDGCVNFGNITASGSGSGAFYAGGVFYARGGDTQNLPQVLEGNKNYGNIFVITSSENARVGGVVVCSSNSQTLDGCENYGEIEITKNGSAVVLAGGVCSLYSTSSSRACVVRNCLNFSKIKFTANAGTHYIGGIVSLNPSYAFVRTYITNCYSFSSFQGSTSTAVFGAIVPAANSSGSNPYVIKDCYALVDEDGLLVNRVNATTTLNISDCVAFSTKGTAAVVGAAIGSLTTNNIGSVSYDEAYSNPSIFSAYLKSGGFFSAEKSTNYYDLIMPMNKALFPSQTAKEKDIHNWTKANGYKRYITTIQQ